MLKYRGGALIRAGFIGVSVAVLVVSSDWRLSGCGHGRPRVRYQAVFPEAGGLGRQATMW